MHPLAVAKSLGHSSNYDDSTLQKKVKSGIDLKLTGLPYIVIDTKNICSSLQHNLKKKTVWKSHSNGRTLSYRYWVEAGITMSDLSPLLDHNLPRLA
ncbi:MAG: hypothetical protein PSV35_09010, partial [bacterium]|nr:hypothetical protein [bacterium]